MAAEDELFLLEVLDTSAVDLLDCDVGCGERFFAVASTAEEEMICLKTNSKKERQIETKTHVSCWLVSSQQQLYPLNVPCFGMCVHRAMIHLSLMNRMSHYPMHYPNLKILFSIVFCEKI